MKHRDRVLMSLSHEQPDRCPMQVSFTPEFADRLRESVHLPSKTHHNPHGGGNTYELERALGEDMLLTSVGWANSYYANDSYNPGHDSYADEWGIVWRNSPYTTPFGQGFYTEIIGNPLAEDSAIAGYKPPDPNRPGLYEESRWVLRNLQGRVLDRRGYRDHDLRNRVGPARLRENPHGFRHGPGSRGRHPGHPVSLPPVRGGEARPHGRGHDLDRGRRGHPARHAHVTRDVAALPQAAHGRLHRRPEEDQPVPEGGLPLGRQRPAHHPRAHRGGRGHPQSRPAAQHGSRAAEEEVRKTALLLGLDRRAAHPAVRDAGRRAQGGCRETADHREGGRAHHRTDAPRPAGHPGGQRARPGGSGHRRPAYRPLTAPLTARPG